MNEAQRISIYHQKAAELRAYAATTNNNALRLEILRLADGFDELAEFTAKQSQSATTG